MRRRRRIMRRRRRIAVGSILLFLLTLAAPTVAQEPYDDVNGDGIPDLPPLIAPAWDDLGDLDDLQGAQTEAEFRSRTNLDAFTGDEGSQLTGPCGGTTISYDRDGISMDMALDNGDDAPPVDANGEQAFTKGNPYEVDPEGLVYYRGSTAPAVFNFHVWEVTVQGIGLDSGGDDNPQDETENEGMVLLYEVLDIPEFSALLKVEGFIEDAEDRCDGSGWVHFKSESNPILTPPGIIAGLLWASGFTGLLFLSRPARTW